LEEETMEASAAPSVIAVGMDGSEHARRALRWAIDEARFRGAALRVVTAWHVPLVVQERGSGSAPPAMVSLEDLVRDAAEGVGSSAVDEVRDAGVEALEPVIREGQAADVLVDVSTGADLLVIGSRGHGGFSGLLAGSVSMQCVQHSHCPTTVVR
jgi:nucleotide-binding universal stress UspA family protein